MCEFVKRVNDAFEAGAGILRGRTGCKRNANVMRTVLIAFNYVLKTFQTAYLERLSRVLGKFIFNLIYIALKGIYLRFERMVVFDRGDVENECKTA